MQHRTRYRTTPEMNSSLAFGPRDERDLMPFAPVPPTEDEFSNKYDYETTGGDPFSIHPCGLDDIEREELEFLAQFIQGSAFYVESLEEYLGEPLEDFWQAREHAYHIVTTYLILNMHAREQGERE